jgi:hypothetical protein
MCGISEMITHPETMTGFVRASSSSSEPEISITSVIYGLCVKPLGTKENGAKFSQLPDKLNRDACLGALILHRVNHMT